MLKWQFQSAKFGEAGFRPLHSIDLRSSDCLIEASSLIIKSFASQEVDKRTARTAYQKQRLLCMQPAFTNHFNNQKLADTCKCT